VNRALRAATVGVLLLSPVALSACSSGQVTQTATQDRDKTGAMGEIGSITLRAVRLVYPADGSYQPGEDAPLELVIANGDTTDDRLVSISGNGFRGVVFGQAVPAPGQTTPPGASGETPGANPSAGTQLGTALPTLPSAGSSASSSAPRSSSAAPGSAGRTSGPAATTTPPSSSPAASSTPQASTSVDVPLPAGQNLLVGIRGGQPCTLVGLTQQVSAAGSLPVTFRFERAGEITVDAIVANPGTVLPTPSPFDFGGDSSNPNDVAGGAGQG
jgi:hypothetical protein